MRICCATARSRAAVGPANDIGMIEAKTLLVPKNKSMKQKACRVGVTVTLNSWMFGADSWKGNNPSVAWANLSHTRNLSTNKSVVKMWRESNSCSQGIFHKEGATNRNAGFWHWPEVWKTCVLQVSSVTSGKSIHLLLSPLHICKLLLRHFLQQCWGSVHCSVLMRCCGIQGQACT